MHSCIVMPQHPAGVLHPQVMSHEQTISATSEQQLTIVSALQARNSAFMKVLKLQCKQNNMATHPSVRLMECLQRASCRRTTTRRCRGHIAVRLHDGMSPKIFDQMGSCVKDNMLRQCVLCHHSLCAAAFQLAGHEHAPQVHWQPTTCHHALQHSKPSPGTSVHCRMGDRMTE